MQVRCQCCEIRVWPKIPKFDILRRHCLFALFCTNIYLLSKFLPSVLHTKFLRFPTFSPEDGVHCRCKNFPAVGASAAFFTQAMI